MATAFTIQITPDASLNISAMSFSTSLVDPNDFLGLLATYTALLRLATTQNPSPAPSDILKAWAQSVMDGTKQAVADYVLQQKLASVTVTTPDLTIS